MKARELALIAVFSALWVVMQLSFGKMIGRISIGPISFHGAVNRLVGWMLMTVLAEAASGFGSITLMTAIATTITRIQRANVFEGLVVGAGYVLAGFLFDTLTRMKERKGVVYYLMVAVITGFAAVIPYWTTKIYFLGVPGFIVAFPLYAYRALKSLILSVIGVKIGITINYTLRKTGFLKSYAQK